MKRLYGWSTKSATSGGKRRGTIATGEILGELHNMRAPSAAGQTENHTESFTHDSPRPLDYVGLCSTRTEIRDEIDLAAYIQHEDMGPR